MAWSRVFSCFSIVEVVVVVVVVVVAADVVVVVAVTFVVVGSVCICMCAYFWELYLPYQTTFTRMGVIWICCARVCMSELGD